MHSLEHTQGQMNLSMLSSRAQALRQDREDGQRGGKQGGSLVQSVGGGESVQPMNEQPTPGTPSSLPPLQHL